MWFVVSLLLFVWPMWRWLGHLLRRASGRWHRRPVQRAVYRNVLRAGFCSRAKPAWVVREVIRLKALMPNAGCRRIATVFNRRFAVRRQMTVSKSFVASAIRTLRYEIEVLRRRIKHRRPRPVPRNRVWGLDVTGKADALGSVHSILGVVDHGTRRALFLDTLLNKNAWTLLGHLFLAIGRFGRPRAVRTDNDGCFTSGVFTAVLHLAGIRHQRTEPGCPWMNGRIERFFGTLKGKLDTLVPADSASLQVLLGEFLVWYNAVRPHQHLDGATPDEAWRGIDPYTAPPKSTEWFEAWGGRLVGFYLRR